MKSKIWLMLKKELRETFRDRKSLSMMLVIPILIPLMVLGMSALFEAQMEVDENEYNRIGFAYEASAEEKNIFESLGIEAVFGDEDELAEKYKNGEIDTYVTKKDSTYTINGTNKTSTNYASVLVESYFTAYKEYLQTEYLTENKIEPTEVLNIISLNRNISDEENFFSSYVTVYGFLFIIMAITVSATYPATDATAGEKERGTLETLLTFPIKSKDIIIGKYLSVSISAAITGFLGLILMEAALYLSSNWFTIYEGVDLMLSPLNLVIVSIIILSFSLLISGLCIAIASKCKTFKEAQSALTPLNFISVFPGMIAFMMEVDSSLLLSIIPFINVTTVFTDLTNGIVNWLEIGLMFASTIVIIAIVLYVIIKQYKSEKVLFAN